MKRKVLITGCPKSATNYISELLSRMGLDFGHERQTESQGDANWKLAPGGRATRKLLRKYNMGCPGMEYYENAIVLHQIRNPLDTMSSCQKITSAWPYICHFIPAETNAPITLRCMQLYYYWNRMAENNSIWSYRIEELPDIWPTFCMKINHPEFIEKKDKIKDIPTNIASNKPYTRLTWEKLEKTDKKLCNEIQKLISRYKNKSKVTVK